MEPRTLYKQDEHAWIEQQIALMRARKFDQLDGDNLVLFLNDMMIRDRSELRSRITNLIMYLLKIQHLSERITPRMLSNIIAHQQEINTLLAQVPRLQAHVPGLFDGAYRDAVKHIGVEDDVPPGRFPPRAPWTLQEIIDIEPSELLARRTEKERLRVPEEAILKVLMGRGVVEVARQFGIPRQTLSDHVKRASHSPAAKPDADAVDNANGEERSGCD